MYQFLWWQNCCLRSPDALTVSDRVSNRHTDTFTDRPSGMSCVCKLLSYWVVRPWNMKDHFFHPPFFSSLSYPFSSSLFLYTKKIYGLGSRKTTRLIGPKRDSLNFVASFTLCVLREWLWARRLSVGRLAWSVGRSVVSRLAWSAVGKYFSS